ncbi:MAG TPA: hypothetical protein DDX92_14260 [Flavobacteriales bacterium]|jgi:hypothetical protein|nr:hypothetical protein [Flavobacteriales bacterium]
MKLYVLTYFFFNTTIVIRSPIIMAAMINNPIPPSIGTGVVHVGQVGNGGAKLRSGVNKIQITIKSFRIFLITIWGFIDTSYSFEFSDVNVFLMKGAFF